ncbi:MAG: hypothetical protein JXA07_08865 [Spirochaetes bacterium]|nr:hypothetical protein [Spirochaetota bacterium]
MKHIAFSIGILALSLPLYAGPFMDVETGPVFTGKNDARISGRYGTRFSLTGTLWNRPSPYIRARVGWTIKERHTITFLAAPLNVEYYGTSSRYLLFRNRLIVPHAPVQANFKFNSWRLTYRYDIVKNDTIEFGLGLTGKIRDAYIRLDSLGVRTTRPDLGFVPLINVRLQWMFVPNLSFLLDADWLVGPQGRAEDILVALQRHVGKHMVFKIGYRILEGGADNKSVYTFSLFHYAVFGATMKY